MSALSASFSAVGTDRPTKLELKSREYMEMKENNNKLKKLKQVLPAVMMMMMMLSKWCSLIAGASGAAVVSSHNKHSGNSAEFFSFSVYGTVLAERASEPTLTQNSPSHSGSRSSRTESVQASSRQQRTEDRPPRIRSGGALCENEEKVGFLAN